MADPTPDPAPTTEPAPEPRRRPDRGRFGPVVLAGLLTAGLAAVVSTRDWYDLGSGGADPALAGGVAASTPEASYPAATAVALVLLAGWGVLLVTRRRVRRAFAVVAVVAAVLLVVATVVAGLDRPTPSDLLQASLPAPEPALTAWYWLGAVLALLAVPPAVLAVRLCPRWPEMGSRYDAPATRTRVDTDAGPGSERELWRSLDEGQDPTAD